MSFLAAYSRNTMAGAARIAAQRERARLAQLPAPEPKPAPVAAPEPESAVVAFVPPMRALITKVAEEHGLTYADIIGPSRFKNILEARVDAIVAVYEARPAMSLTQIGKLFHRDHTTVLHSLKKRGLR